MVTKSLWNFACLQMFPVLFLIQALSKLTQMHHLVDSMISGIAPNSRSRVRPQSFTLEALCLLLEIISPKLRPVRKTPPWGWEGFHRSRLAEQATQWLERQ